MRGVQLATIVADNDDSVRWFTLALVVFVVVAVVVAGIVMVVLKMATVIM